MGAIANIFAKYGDLYIDKHKNNIPINHVKAITSIQDCRTLVAGINFYSCQSCDKPHSVFRSCGNRNCPNCQKNKGEEWLEKRLEDRLPCNYFMITFTIPEELRRFFRSNQKFAYSAMFKAASDALRELAADPRFIGIDLPGFFGVLHTWGRQLQYHPHIHFIVPGGGIDKKSQTWKKSKDDFYVSVFPLSKLFRGKLGDLICKENLLYKTPNSVWQKNFVVNSQAVGDSPEGPIKYLAPYVFRVAISDSRIISVKNNTVTFSYKKKNSKRLRTTTLNVFEFMRRFLQHVLPRGFMKVRYYGFMGAGCKIPTKQIIQMIYKENPNKKTMIKVQHKPNKQEKQCLCKHCGGKLKLIRVILAHEVVFGVD